jgi:hypothetical protein
MIYYPKLILHNRKFVSDTYYRVAVDRLLEHNGNQSIKSIFSEEPHKMDSIIN